jgi:NAD(P)-dependent dehydrogenase (short-subunit alcohol dehydrogenase family)
MTAPKPSHVLITGALTGIGRAAAFAFAQPATDLVVSGRNAQTGEALASRTQVAPLASPPRSSGRRPPRRGGRRARRPDRRALRPPRHRRQQRRHRRPARPIDDQTAESYAATFDTNVLGTLLSLKHELRVMQAQGAAASSTSPRPMAMKARPERRSTRPASTRSKA